MIIRRKITLRSISRPSSNSLNQELQWFGHALGLFTLRDKDKSCFRIFIELLKAVKQHKTLSSDELAYKLALSRGTVVHHLNRLMESGIVISDKNHYLLRVENLTELIDEIERDLKRTCLELKKVAEDIDIRL